MNYLLQILDTKQDIFTYNRAISTLGDYLFDSKDITKLWMNTPNYYFLFQTPKHTLLNGHGDEVVKYLCELLLNKNRDGFETPTEMSRGVL